MIGSVVSDTFYEALRAIDLSQFDTRKKMARNERWDLIRTAYEAMEKTVTEIAEEHDVSFSHIVSKAREEGWVRRGRGNWRKK